MFTRERIALPIVHAAGSQQKPYIYIARSLKNKQKVHSHCEEVSDCGDVNVDGAFAACGS